MTEDSLFYIFSFPIFASNSNSSNASFPYSQPRMVELLILVSFLFLLNVARTVADYFLHGGIIAEIVLGMVYGRPLAGILPASWEETFTVLGYLGLIGIVFEGGLSTELDLLFANLPLSLICALTGIGLPVALSFALLAAGYGYVPLEAFAAGAALSSTSLGTTLMALNTVTSSITRNGAIARPDNNELSEFKSQDHESTTQRTSSPSLQKSRIGTILISTAVIDDVIGLVLASLVPALSAIKDTPQQHSGLAWTIIRPILSSVLMASITPIVARFILRPVLRYRNLGPRWYMPKELGKPWGLSKMLKLFSRRQDPRPNAEGRQWGTQSDADAVSVSLMILLVTAFSTIAFYTGSSVLFGAYLAGLTVTYISQPASERTLSTGFDEEGPARSSYFEDVYARTFGSLQKAFLAPLFFASIGYAIPFISLWRPAILWRGAVYALLMSIAKLCVGVPILIWGLLSAPQDPSQAQTSCRARLRNSVYPALFLGVAMVARGEIGLLIAQLARTNPMSTSGDEGLLGDEAFVVCIWAILLCTLFSPIGVGFIVQRMGSRVVRGIWA